MGLASCSEPSGSAAQGSPSVAQTGPKLGQSRFVSATITRKFDSSGQMTNDRLTINDREELATLEAYFSQAGRGERGPLTGGWVPAVIITFKPALGREVKIHSNYEVWSEGTGDWPAKRGLKDHVQRLFSRKAEALTAIDHN